MEGYLGLLRGLLCRDGVGQMRVDAEVALVGLSGGSPWRAAAMLIKGASYLLDAQADQADPILAHAVEIGTHIGALPAASTALVERCLVAIAGHDWSKAETLAEQALSMVQAGQLDDYLMSPLVYTVAARTALYRGGLPQAREHLARAARLRPLLTYAIPWSAVQTLLEMARAYLLLDDTAGAKAVVRQARDILRVRPDLGVLPAQTEEMHAKLDTTRGRLIGRRRSPPLSCGCFRCCQPTSRSRRSATGCMSPSTR